LKKGIKLTLDSVETTTAARSSKKIETLNKKMSSYIKQIGEIEMRNLEKSRNYTKAIKTLDEKYRDRIKKMQLEIESLKNNPTDPDY